MIACTPRRGKDFDWNRNWIATGRNERGPNRDFAMWTPKPRPAQRSVRLTSERARYFLPLQMSAAQTEHWHWRIEAH
jgi:hypothetical protein